MNVIQHLRNERMNYSYHTIPNNDTTTNTKTNKKTVSAQPVGLVILGYPVRGRTFIVRSIVVFLYKYLLTIR